ncbi:hypothetical protein [Sorangium sp. So ce1153]
MLALCALALGGAACSREAPSAEKAAPEPQCLKCSPDLKIVRPLKGS